ncbi:hypothetical protein [Cryptosporangium arvum]|uniref:hypothetical protein n=1 Tax=Cryptosporangium arvum TaxID=80871 RepID=UPI0004B44E84|nr:hypothetical protein [Cryptosporangium arvum]
MRVSKASLAGLLLEEGEEDLAVLLARSDLPDEIDVERDAPTLRAIGLSGDELHALLPTITGAAAHASMTDMSDLEQAISDRWAYLVDDWTGTARS